MREKGSPMRSKLTPEQMAEIRGIVDRRLVELQKPENNRGIGALVWRLIDRGRAAKVRERHLLDMLVVRRAIDARLGAIPGQPVSPQGH